MWFGWTRKWGERRLHGCGERKMWICMLSLYCPQSAAEKSILINSISIPRLKEQQNYEGKRMSSDTGKQEKWCLLLCVLWGCWGSGSWSVRWLFLHDHWCQKGKFLGIWSCMPWPCRFSFCFRFLTNKCEYWNVKDVGQVCFWFRELLPHFPVLSQFS